MLVRTNDPGTDVSGIHLFANPTKPVGATTLASGLVRLPFLRVDPVAEVPPEGWYLILRKRAVLTGAVEDMPSRANLRHIAIP